MKDTRRAPAYNAGMTVLHLDHVQLAIPRGGEAAARGFYADLLGLRELPKPEALVARGGVWFEAGALQVHLGVDPDFRPATKAHPAFVVDDFARLAERLREADYVLHDDVPVGGRRRVFVADPFGNRIELIDGSNARDLR